MIRKASASWQKGLKKGSGRLFSESGALNDVPYSFSTRFESEKGTNPEELIGAAHAGCFSMFLAGLLEQSGHTPDHISTTSSVKLESTAEGWSVKSVHLDVSVLAPNVTEETLRANAETAKRECPISRLLKCEITLSAKLRTHEKAA